MEHLARRPAMEPRDVYKLLYQGVRGPGHIIISTQAFTERLAAEWHALDPAEDDPLWESIRPDESLLRLNLRPFKAAGGHLDELLHACLETGRRSWGGPAEFQAVWEQCVAVCSTHPWPGLDWDTIATFTAWIGVQGFPPVHHSERYRSLYRPAYRLVAGDVRLQGQMQLRQNSDI